MYLLSALFFFFLASVNCQGYLQLLNVMIFLLLTLQTHKIYDMSRFILNTSTSQNIFINKTLFSKQRGYHFDTIIYSTSVLKNEVNY